MIGVGTWRIWKEPSLSLLAAYAFLIITETVLIRYRFTGNHFKPELFWSWRAWDKQKSQILTNVFMFVPIGVLAGWLWKWKGLLVAAGLSISVEMLQMITQRGLCEVDDVIHNVLGAVIGVAVVMFVRWSGKWILKNGQK